MPFSLKFNPTPTSRTSSWTRSSNVIYLDVLPKVGFTRGTYSVKGSSDVGVLVVNFLKSFLKVFPEMNGLNLFLAGYSLSGTYASYAAQKIYAQQSQLGLKLQGMLLMNALIAASDFQMYAATTKFVTENNDVFKFDAAKLQKLLATDKQCGFSEYLKKFLTYPPSGHFPEITKALDPSNPPWFTPDCMNLYSQVNTGTRSYPIGEHTLMLLSFDSDVHGSPTRFEPMEYPRSRIGRHQLYQIQLPRPCRCPKGFQPGWCPTLEFLQPVHECEFFPCMII
ncbi:hypothetical protein Pst134EA_005411 [Puccinia striiformis f. sp. tritici]|uniref:hypothetical protein n=1 Tax=Puccinia striiformis f. sp. tritici TaxID=168172 RepID=UPI002008BB7B|nr:hypothetical protein Pst134EA_005411 [Puccinia striiformis f. sp. tritici]KAH9471517.1 hypothetical protein Pst134EA_005411 [Puccinia striiformis f. sp. tritici]